MATLIRDRSAIVQTTEGQFRIRPDTADEDPWQLTSDAPMDIRHGAIHVATGATYGPVRVTVESGRTLHRLTVSAGTLLVSAV